MADFEIVNSSFNSDSSDDLDHVYSAEDKDDEDNYNISGGNSTIHV